MLQDHSRIEKFVRRTLDLELEEEKICPTGLNWGEMKFDQNTLTVVSAGQGKQEYNGHRILDINLNTVEKVQLYAPCSSNRSRAGCRRQ